MIIHITNTLVYLQAKDPKRLDTIIKNGEIKTIKNLQYVKTTQETEK